LPKRKQQLKLKPLLKKRLIKQLVTKKLTKKKGRQAFDTSVDDTDATSPTTSRTDDLCAKYGHINDMNFFELG